MSRILTYGILQQINAISQHRIVAFPLKTSPTPVVSTNLGVNWSNLTQVTTCNVGNPYSIRMNGDKLLFIGNSASAENAGFSSQNSGTTWYANPTTSQYMWGTAISSNGSAMFTSKSHAGSGVLYYSYTSGTSFSATATFAGGRQIVTNFDGSKVVVASVSTTAGRVYTNNCTTFGTYTFPFATTDIIGNEDASLIFATPYGSTHSIYAYTTNNGTNWTTVTIESNVGSGYHNLIAGSLTAQYVLLANPTRCYVSNNYGVSGSWTEVMTGIRSYTANCRYVSKSGKYMIVGGVGKGVFYLSDDYGVTWSTKNTGFAYTVGTAGVEEI